MDVSKAKITVKPLDSFKNGFSQKYRNSLETFASVSVSECKEANPHWGLVEVLSHILKTTNPQMPPVFLAEFVQHIIAEWENSEVETQEEVLLEAV
jgi:hypothetical protein